MIRIVSLLVLFSFSIIFSLENVAQGLIIDVKIRINSGTLDSAYCIVANNTTNQTSTFESSKEILKGASQSQYFTWRFKKELSVNSDYTISFCKPGYITKKIKFITDIDAERLSQGLNVYDFVVVLFKKIDSVDISIFNQPITVIQYSKYIDDFDYAAQVKFLDVQFYNSGVENFKLKNYQAAINDFTEALKINSNDVDALYNRGVANYKLGNLMSACEDWKLLSTIVKSDADGLIDKYCKE